MTNKELEHEKMNKSIEDITKLFEAPENGDPLNVLHQIDEEGSYPLEKTALIMMVRMLDDIEEIGALSEGINHLMAKDKVVKTRILTLFKTLIQGIREEYNTLTKTEIVFT